MEKFIAARDVTTAKSKRKPRADSVRNRERLLAAAGEVFSAGGPDASLEAVARTAGVGIGTLYRHFPTREALFQAVYQHDVAELVTLAAELAERAEPLQALRTFLRATVRMVATKKGMVAALSPSLDGSAEIMASTAARLQGALADLMAQAQASGSLRADINAEELLRAMVGLCYTRSQPGWQETVTRLLDIFVDGLATVPPAAGDPPPGPGL